MRTAWSKLKTNPTPNTTNMSIPCFFSDSLFLAVGQEVNLRLLTKYILVQNGVNSDLKIKLSNAGSMINFFYTLP